MGAKQSTTGGSPRVRTNFSSSVSNPIPSSTTSAAGLSLLRQAGTSTDSRQRARSLSSVPNGHGQPMSIPPVSSGAFGASGSPESDTSTPDDAPFGRVFVAQSLPAQLWSFNGIKCPVCSKFVLPDDVECHLVMCLTKPRISYNEDVLSEDKGECVICLDDLKQGDTIARLPCLCIYHKRKLEMGKLIELGIWVSC
uniref:RING-type E3 ubiquitin transferase n=1 Tax=Strigamia maritima TaxID=126957 RepID=T1INZ4_STRMM